MKVCLEAESKSRQLSLTRERQHLELTKGKIETDMKKAFQAKLDGVVSDEFSKQVFGGTFRNSWTL